MNTQASQIISIPQGEAICVQGERMNQVYNLVHGQVDIWINDKKILQLSPANLIGLESKYEEDGICPYTALAATECRIKPYDSNYLPEILFSIPRLGEIAIESLCKQLNHCWELFSSSKEDFKDNQYFLGEIKTYSPGEYILKEGEKTTNIYRIISTSEGIELTRQNKTLKILSEPGEFFGEMAALLEEPRSATAHSIGESVLEVYPSHQLPNILRDYPRFSVRIIRDLCRRLADMNQMLYGD